MPELRKDPFVSNRWIIFSPERKQRPVEFSSTDKEKGKEPFDVFSWGKENLTPHEVFALRPKGGLKDSPGWSVRVVPNKYPALRIEGDLQAEGIGIFDRMNGIGAHEVIIENPNPDIELEDQTVEGIAGVLQAYRERILDLQQDIRFRYILIFKNKGRLAGATLKHPHSQLIALPIVPREIKEKIEQARRHFGIKERGLFADVLREELRSGERVIMENSFFAAFCPWASRFPFESWIMPKFSSLDFSTLDDNQIMLLSDILQNLLRRLKKGLQNPDYNMVLQTAPLRNSRQDYMTAVEVDFRWHIEILPRISYLAGFELGSEFFINPVFPEEAADFLRQIRKI
ncbi:galactose-1-phosphate uridylyltransferase [Methylacidiphilum caldifontis]|uniref:Galactose-1-phosphate uridylyltransferase n=1 Tax=Methylacidiphilum caldifontis TaxID=2795386 RepID=A0A4Y8PA50_9BACT|nr:DUF4931 domain-containing protein [Methylacidiphilum caldifontis]QSR89533.1 DUF4931 domain-containing protein [Methylacidiphilum caldifontis]TFE67707.1 galactose-1-phosphate uridylyltransferase [Methylacidiphilum caldifontis]